MNRLVTSLLVVIVLAAVGCDAISNIQRAKYHRSAGNAKAKQLQKIVMEKLASGQTVSRESEETHVIEERVVYGSDNRVDEYSPSLLSAKKLNGDKTVALIPPSQFDDFDLTTTSTLEDSAGVCEEQRFSHQITAAFCSGFLVGKDLIATAGHCVNTCDDLDGVFVFDYVMTDSTHVKTHYEPNDIYFCESIHKHGYDIGVDFAIIKLDRDVVGRTPVNLRRVGDISSSTKLYMVGHPSGLPRKYTAAVTRGNAKVIDNYDGEDNTFLTNLDAFGGNSGSAVFNFDTNEVEGILVEGEQDYVDSEDDDCKVVNVCEDDGSDCTGESVTRISLVKDYVPYDCSFSDSCFGFGTCDTDTGVCDCDGARQGSDCLYECGDDDDERCGRHGECSGPVTCECDFLYRGDQCDCGGPSEFNATLGATYTVDGWSEFKFFAHNAGTYYLTTCLGVLKDTYIYADPLEDGYYSKTCQFELVADENTVLCPQNPYSAVYQFESEGNELFAFAIGEANGDTYKFKFAAGHPVAEGDTVASCGDLDSDFDVYVNLNDTIPIEETAFVRFTAPHAGSYVFTTCTFDVLSSDSINTVAAAVTDCEISDLSFDDYECPSNLRSTVEFEAEEGEDVLLLVSSDGDEIFNVKITDAGASRCQGSSGVLNSDNSIILGTTLTYTAEDNAYHRFSTCGMTDIDTVLAVLDTDCSVLLFDDDSCSTQSQIELWMNEGDQITIGVFEYNSFASLYLDKKLSLGAKRTALPAKKTENKPSAARVSSREETVADTVSQDRISRLQKSLKTTHRRDDGPTYISINVEEISSNDLCLPTLSAAEGDTYGINNGIVLSFLPSDDGNLTITTCVSGNIGNDDLDTVIEVLDREWCSVLEDVDDPMGECGRLALISIQVYAGEPVWVRVRTYDDLDYTVPYNIEVLFGEWIENDDGGGDDGGDDDDDDDNECPPDETNMGEGDHYEYGFTTLKFTASDDESYTVTITACVVDNAGYNESSAWIEIGVLDDCDTDWSSSYDDECEYGSALPTISFDVSNGDHVKAFINQEGFEPLTYNVAYSNYDDSNGGGGDEETCPSDDKDPEDNDIYEAKSESWVVEFSAEQHYSVALTTCLPSNSVYNDSSYVALMLLDGCTADSNSLEDSDAACDDGKQLPTITFTVNKGTPAKVIIQQYGYRALDYKVKYEGRDDNAAASASPLAWLVLLCVSLLFAGAM